MRRYKITLQTDGSLKLLNKFLWEYYINQTVEAAVFRSLDTYSPPFNGIEYEYEFNMEESDFLVLKLKVPCTLISYETI